MNAEMVRELISTGRKLESQYQEQVRLKERISNLERELNPQPQNGISDLLDSFDIALNVAEKLIGTATSDPSGAPHAVVRQYELHGLRRAVENARIAQSKYNERMSK